MEAKSASFIGRADLFKSNRGEMHKQIAVRIICIAVIASGIAAFLTAVLAEAASTTLLQCVDHPAGSSVPSGCHVVADNTIYPLKPIMNEGFKQLAISVSITGAVILAVTGLTSNPKARLTGKNTQAS